MPAIWNPEHTAYLRCLCAAGTEVRIEAVDPRLVAAVPISPFVLLMLTNEVSGTGARDSTDQSAHSRMIDSRANQRAASRTERTSDESIALTRGPVASREP